MMQKKNLPKQSLKGSILDLFTSDIIQDILESYNCSEQCVLILDEKSSHLISNYFTMADLISKGIFSIELLRKLRKPFETYQAIYIISNTPESIDLLVKDFDYNSDDKEHFSFYKNCHVYLIDPLTKNRNIFNSMMNEYFLRKIKTFKEIFFDFIALDRNLYYFGEEYNFNPIYQLFFLQDNQLQNNICIKKLYSICLMTQTFPNIIYFIHDANCKYIAENLSQKLETYYTNQKKIVKNGTLLITSRLLDLPGPIQFDLNYDHLLFESYKNNSDSEKKMINIDLQGNGKKKIILDHNDILYDKYRLLNIYDVLNTLPTDLDKFNSSDIAKVNKVSQMESLNEMDQAIKNFNDYQYMTRLFSQHLDIAKRVNENCQKRNIMNLVDLQSTIMAGQDDNGSKVPIQELNSRISKNKEHFTKSDIMRLLFLMRYYNPDNDINEITDNMSNKMNITGDNLKMIEFFSPERCSIDENVMNRLNREIILFRGRNKYSNLNSENRKDKRYIFIRESKLTTLCDMCCKNELPEEDFTYVIKPKLMNANKINKKYKANILIQNQDLDLQSENMLNIDNLIVFNVGGLSTYEISSLEKGIKNKQFNMNLIYGSNQIYNHEEYLRYIDDYFKGKSGIVKDMNINLNNNYNKTIDIEGENDSREGLKYPQNTIEKLNENQQQKISINRNSNITNNIIKTSSINNKDTLNYGGIHTSSAFNPDDQNNIRNTLESYDFSDMK
jgi:hypothetical protein